ncbi:MAG: tetraacyldisaccharide 4'-kinase [Phycisphaerae bacterium]|nr:MAG: tetraacyldisaccharide 4'-kinase [Phycisphaerae bacterium]
MSRWHDWHEDVVSGRSGVLSSVLRGGLDIASHVYGAAVRWRNRSFDNGKRETQSVSVPVISVGNLTTGGTGKSPMVIELARRLIKMGRRPAVVSRGYKSESTGESDEIMMMRQALPELQCVANVDRVVGANAAIANGADVILLDDGFQHRRLARDLDLVLIDATRPFGFGHLLPRGFLREPIENTKRADAIVLTRFDEVTDHRRAELLRLTKKLVGGGNVLTCTHRTDSFEPMQKKNSAVRSPKKHQPVLLVSGIGNPDSFERTVREQNIEVAGHLKYADHRAYGDADAEAIRTEAARLGAMSVITTAKDAPKLDRLGAIWTVPVFVCTVQIDFPDDDGERMNKLLAEATAK